jgi:WD40 repeat protein
MTSERVSDGRTNFHVRNRICLPSRFRINRFLDPVTSLCLSNDGNVFLVGSLDSTLRLIDKDDGSLYREFVTVSPSIPANE